MNTSWLVYLNLENELKECFNYVYFNDNLEQQKVYSNKFAEILLRASIEIETLAKELYVVNGGTKPLNSKLKFDNDCIDLLNKKFNLDKKVVFISYPFFDYKKDENKEITPFSHFEMTDSNNWQHAYQGIKHDRLRFYRKGNLKNAVHSVAALYLLNIYLKNEKFKIKHADTYKFDTRFGSTLFSLDKPSDKTNMFANAYVSERSVFEYKLTKLSQTEYERQHASYINRFLDFVKSTPEMREKKFSNIVLNLKNTSQGVSFVFQFFNALVKYRIDKQLESLTEEEKCIKLGELINNGIPVPKEMFEQKYNELLLIEERGFMNQYPPTFLQYGCVDSEVEIYISSNNITI